MIIPVKKAELFVLKDQLDDLLKVIQAHELLMIDENEQANKVDVSELEELLTRVNRTINYLKSLREKRKFFEFYDATYEELDNRSGLYLNILKEVESLEKKVNEEEKKLKELKEEIAYYLPFKQNELNLEDMAQTKYIMFHHGFIDLKKQDELEEFFVEHNIAYSFFEADKRGMAVTFAALKEEETYFQEAKRIDFKKIKTPVYDGDISEYIENLTTKETKHQLFLNEHIQALSLYVPKINELYIYADQLASDIARMQVSYVVHSEKHNIVKLTGWIRTDKEKKINKILKNNKFDYELETYEPKDDDNPPTALQNNKFVEPFEVISGQYGDPHSRELDPNPSMSFWYWVIFGIMMGDVGYGLLMMLGFGLFLKLLKPKGNSKKLITVLFYSSFTTMFFGILFGSFFGFDFDLGKIIGSLFNQNWTTVVINPIENALEMLIISMIIGLIQIIHGLVLKAILHFKLKDPQGAFAEGISYIFMLLGLGLLLLSFIDLPIKISVWYGISSLIIGGLLIIVFMSNDKPGVMGKVTGKLGGFYGIINQLSDILSYSRILALALSTAVIAFTFNLLAEMIQGSIIGILASILIYIVGHIFNLAIGLLSTYIHDARLQYVEFFGKFFEGGGYLYQPLSLQLNHLNEIKNLNSYGGNKK